MGTVPGVRGVRRQPPSSPGFTGGKSRHTALTKGFTGRLARGIHNRLLEELNQEERRFYRIRCNEDSSETSR